MHNFSFRGSPVGGEADLPRDITELGMQVLPFAHPAVVQVLGLAQSPELAGRSRPALLAEILPQVEPAVEVRLFVTEPCMGLIRLGLFLDGTLSRILNGERRNDDENL